MDIDTAPVADRADDAECDVDGCGGVYVLYDGDRVCRVCGHLSGTGGNEPMDYREKHLPKAWVSFEKTRDSDKYSGFTGQDRIKFVGGFASAYDFGPDFFGDDR